MRADGVVAAQLVAVADDKPVGVARLSGLFHLLGQPGLRNPCRGSDKSAGNDLDGAVGAGNILAVAVSRWFSNLERARFGPAGAPRRPTMLGMGSRVV